MHEAISNPAPSTPSIPPTYPLNPPILLSYLTSTMFPYPFDEALILVLLLFIIFFISDSDIPKKARVVIISGFILAIISGFILAIIPWFLRQTQYHYVVLYNDVQTCREETTRQRHTAKRCGFKLGDCMKVVRACAEELREKIEGGE